ncbi:MAG TPA: hypothetical protein VIY68_11025 [Steroidobacteraceae bacterium]
MFRLTALKRLPALDLQSPKVQHTINMMVDRKIAIDPTLGVHEQLLLRRDGKIPSGEVDYFDHMPIGWRRDNMKALADTSAPGDDQAYRLAFDKLVEVARMLHDRGVFIVFGRSDQESESDQDHQHGDEGWHGVLPQRGVPEIWHSALCCCAKNRGGGRGEAACRHGEYPVGLLGGSGIIIG